MEGVYAVIAGANIGPDNLVTRTVLTMGRSLTSCHLGIQYIHVWNGLYATNAWRVIAPRQLLLRCSTKWRPCHDAFVAYRPFYTWMYYMPCWQDVMERPMVKRVLIKLIAQCHYICIVSRTAKNQLRNKRCLSCSLLVRDSNCACADGYPTLALDFQQPTRGFQIQKEADIAV